MKLNWASGIVFVLFLFIVFILNLVYKCTQVNVDLVAENYYEKEIKYQEQINREKNTMELEQDIQILQKDQSVLIVYPVDFIRNEIKGNIQFFKPEDASLDFLVEINPQEDMTQEVNAINLKPGWWEVKIQWSYRSTDYYTEAKLRI